MTTRLPAVRRLPGCAAPALFALALAGCAQIKREPLQHPPPVVRPPAAAASPLRPTPGSLYRADAAGQALLFEDYRPRQVGDVITIMLSENANASKSSGNNLARSSQSGLDLGLMPRLLGGLLTSAQNIEVGGSQALNAEGGAQASNSFNGVLTVTVAEVLANGNFVVSGEKQMLINQGTEYIRFSGVVNPRSLSAGNSVLSSMVADARIEYSARGVLDEAQTMGWLQRFFINVLPM